ncbi:hypothetical protein FHT92_003311 [Rhizobium sp. BK377]|nr:hypothetical protein [Rhizobium sp. BK377]
MEDLLEEEACSFDDHAFAPMVSLEMDVGMFRSQWQFCDRITEYLSDILGQGRSDPARYSNFLSVATNELVELAFRSTSASGKISFDLCRSPTFNRLRIAFPCEKADEDTSERASKDQPVPGAGSEFLLKSDGAVLLNDLAAIFRAAIRIETDGALGVRIIADFPLNEDFR